MLDRSAFEYVIVRVVPHVEREEFVNAGVILHCRARDYLDALIALDETRLLALAPDADVALVRRHLDAIPRICAGGADAGPIGLLPLDERWHWLVATRSTILQTSPAHVGVCVSPVTPSAALARIVDKVVRPLRPRGATPAA